MTTAAETQEETEPEDHTNETGPQPRRRALIIAAVTIGVLIVAVVSFGIGLWINAPKHPGNDSAEAGFARDMSTHHAQAVSMSMIEYRTGGEPGLRAIAYDIALTQQAQIGMMDQWLSQWSLPQTGDGPRMGWMSDGHNMLLPDGRMPGMASSEQLEQLGRSSGHDADVLFCRLMIAHHLGGIHMAEAVLAKTDNEDVRKLAQSMKDGQQYEINALQQKLTALGTKP